MRTPKFTILFMIAGFLMVRALRARRTLIRNGGIAASVATVFPDNPRLVTEGEEAAGTVFHVAVERMNAYDSVQILRGTQFCSRYLLYSWGLAGVLYTFVSKRGHFARFLWMIQNAPGFHRI